MDVDTRELLVYNDMKQRWVRVAASSSRVQFNQEIVSLAALWQFVGLLEGGTIVALMLR